MKKRHVVALFLAVAMLPAMCFASVLDANWQDADVDALKDAAAAINARIIELSSAGLEVMEQVDTMVFEGKGSGVIKLPKVEQLPLLIHISADKKDMVKINATGSYHGFWGGDFFLDHRLESVQLFSPHLYSDGDETEAPTLLVDAKQNWKISFFDPPTAGTLDFSGSGMQVGGFFSIDEGGIVPTKVSYNASKYRYDDLFVILHYEKDGRWESLQLLGELLQGKNRKGTHERFVELPQAERCFYMVQAGSKTSWSITVGP